MINTEKSQNRVGISEIMAIFAPANLKGKA